MFTRWYYPYKYDLGDRVKITTGIYQNYKGKIIQIDSSQKHPYIIKLDTKEIRVFDEEEIGAYENDNNCNISINRNGNIAIDI